jgi:hypothetical protein
LVIIFPIFLIQNGLKERDALSPFFFFQISLKYTIRKIQGNRRGQKLNGTHHLLVCADDVNLLNDNIDIIKNKKHTLIDASKEVGLEVNQNAGQNHDIKIGI